MSLVTIQVDYREIGLLKYLEKEITSGIEVNRVNLPVGDVIISLNGSLLSVIERKTLTDLSSSIKDGRYKEQAFRLGELPLPKHHIYYLVEGNLSTYPNGPRYMSKAGLLSAMITLNYSKGFSTHRTQTTSESAEWILNLSRKLYKIHTAPKSDESSDIPPVYTSVIPKVKQKHLTPANICAVMLAQIPGVGHTKAQSITKSFSTLPKLISALQSDPDALNCIQLTSARGRQKKLDHKTKTRIYEYLHINSINHPGH